MTDNLKKAKRTLDEGSHTLVLCSDTQTYTDTARGVAPLLSFVDNGKSLRGFCAADKVVGAGAAYLYVLLGAEEVYANVISQRAKEILATVEESAKNIKLTDREEKKVEKDESLITFEDCLSEQVIEEIKNTDINTLSPYECMTLLFDWKKRLS